MQAAAWLLQRHCTLKDIAAGACARRKCSFAQSPLQEYRAARTGSAEAAWLLHHLVKKLMPLMLTSCNMLIECMLFRKKNERTHCEAAEDLCSRGPPAHRRSPPAAEKPAPTAQVAATRAAGDAMLPRKILNCNVQRVERGLLRYVSLCV